MNYYIFHTWILLAWRKSQTWRCCFLIAGFPYLSIPHHRVKKHFLIKNYFLTKPDFFIKKGLFGKKLTFWQNTEFSIKTDLSRKVSTQNELFNKNGYSTKTDRPFNSLFNLSIQKTINRFFDKKRTALQKKWLFDTIRTFRQK